VGKPPVIEGEYTLVRWGRRTSPPVTVSEFASWSWPAKAFYVAGCGLVLFGGTAFARWLWAVLS
jgi:hypothetical protein